MSRPGTWRWAGPLLLAGTLTMGAGLLAVAAAKDLPPESGPDVVVLRELQNIYEVVPFEHRSHAKMAQMWNGCVTCHHRSPQPATPAAGAAPVQPVPAGALEGASSGAGLTQEASARIPACKSCHPAKAVDTDVHRPSLKGAYHRQCLNCHKEWMHENACVICHPPRQGRPAGKVDPTPDDIVGRMHPPIPEPKVKAYKTRFTPADGPNVLFRHKEHTVAFGIKCVACHHQDNCAACHGPTGEAGAPKPLRPGMTWNQSHEPCVSCHKEDRCRQCHYQDDRSPPPAFDHMATGQGLDEEHAKLGCEQCHPSLEVKAEPTCGEAACHKDQDVDYPTQRPGPIVTTLAPTPAGPAAGEIHAE